ncbi:MAG: EAL domain-containing protein [Clostridia bacterium]|nr:EAL domain-containing protein [Clostridia bacterium]
MHSIKTKITAMTLCVVIIAMAIAAAFGVTAIRDIGNRDAKQTLLLLCETGQKDLDSYFRNVENSVKTVSAYVESDLDGIDDKNLQSHMERVSDVFQKLAYNTNGVLTYYYRIDPEVSRNVKGFWYVNTKDNGFQEHEVTDISDYNTNDTSSLVWFTVPKTSGKGVWLPPYITENLDARVISYNVPVYFDEQFIGVIGIEIDYSTMAQVVNHITLYDNGYAFLNDDKGKIIYHPQMDVTTMETQPKVPSGLLSNDKYISYSYDGIKKQAVWLPLSNGMRLNVTVPVQEINGVWYKLVIEIAIVFAVLLVILIVLIMTFTGRITKPLRKLTMAAEQIKEGYYDTELDYDKKDEVGVLTASFKNLIMNLNIYIKNLNDMAYIDALTGIGNRLAIRRDYDSYQGHEVTVMMLDLNDFKLINDTRGHDEGDRILQEISKLLSDIFGKEHCYRYGGDEILVIIPDISSSEFNEKLEALKQNKPKINGTARADFSIGFVRALLKDSDTLRTLISTADEKMYESKREKKHAFSSGHGMLNPQNMSTEYTVENLKKYLQEMSEKYALARVVDPIECRIIELQDDGKINMNENCYGIWNSEQKCINCSSALACRTGCHQEKAEHFKDKYYFVQSNPIKLKLSNGSVYDAVVELVNVEKEGDAAINNREAENVGTRAAHYLAHHDSLTNVLNSDAFYELARGMIKDSKGKSWVMITSNIMNFRLVNTLFGEQKGNEVLAKTASMLREVSESSRGLCGRLGSDQFAMLIPRIAYDKERLTSIAQTLAQIYNSGIYKFNIHFGVYEIDDPSIPVSVMCGRANSALRTIRDDLTSIVAYFDDTILQKTVLEQTVLGSFEEALSSGQFKMYLQPLVRKDKAVIGAEALARWYRPDGSMIMPGDFIETLETAGLIHKLDMYIWELAVKQLSLWKGTAKQNLTISVNVSAKDFYSIDVLKVLTELVDKYGVDSRMLRLEITETAFLGEPDNYEDIVSELRQKGFLVEIDDFGKDNSTLSFLKDIKADVLKIDMSFLQEIRDSERNRIILKSVISLADSLEMEVITEGIETEEQFRELTELGCNHFQGYFFCHPVPVDVFETKYFTGE